jgi:glycerol-3-phosphate dehydrogenase (NAD(P)+)
MMKVAVLGAGAWGTALAKVLADKQFPTTIWSHRREVADQINSEHLNVRYLPGFLLPETLRATTDLEEALRDSELVVVVIPSHGLRHVMRDARRHIPSEALLCSASKGIENDSLMLMSDVLLEELGHAVQPRLTFLSGPSFAKEVASRMPTTVVVAGTSEREADAVLRAFHTDMFRTYLSSDVVGVEIGGALKNVIAIAAGVSDGLGFGHNTRAGLITRGLAEIGRLAAQRGANPLTVAGLAGMGDLVLTCTGELSRNRTVGLALGRGEKLKDVLGGMTQVAEGVRTAKSVHDMAAKLGVEMPLHEAVYRILYEDLPAKAAVHSLATRELKSEFQLH